MDLYADPRDEVDSYRRGRSPRSPSVVITQMGKKRKVGGEVDGHGGEDCGYGVCVGSSANAEGNGKGKAKAEDQGREIVVLD